MCHLFDRGVHRAGTTVKHLWRQLLRSTRDILPLWTNASHVAAIQSTTASHEQRVRELRAQHIRDIEVERSQIENLLPKLIKVTSGYQRDRYAGRFTITTQLSEDFVYQILSGYARDARAMDYIGERMAYDIVRQIRTLDFSRTRALAEFDNGHRERISWMNPDGMNFPPK